MLSELELVRGELRDGEALLGAVDRVLLEIVREVPTDGFERGKRERGKPEFKRTPEAVRCFLAMFCRLDLKAALGVRTALDAERLFPSGRGGGTGESSGLLARVQAYDPSGGYPRDAMCAALSCGDKGAVNKHLASARRVLGEAILRRELAARGGLLEHGGDGIGAASMVARLRAAEAKLSKSGLLPSYRRTRPVKRQFDGLIDALEGPTAGYADAGAKFEFVLEQLEGVEASLQGICVSEDIPVKGNEDYVRKQFARLAGGICIERIFLYDEKDEEEMLRAIKTQKRKAGEAVKRGLAEGLGPGSYTPYLLARSSARDEDPGEEFISMVIIDRELPARRVIRQRFSSEGSLNHREVTVSDDHVERAIELFDALKQNSREA
ncbi:MAG: hypothetical protein ACYDC2_02180 [Solirubrobacteraceae bacterium]